MKTSDELIAENREARNQLIAYEQMAFRVYMDIHVSALGQYPRSVQTIWKLGQDIFDADAESGESSDGGV